MQADYEIENIAYQNPFFGGEAVYYARAMLRLDVQDQIPQLRRRGPIHKSISGATIYPNPAGNYFTFNYNNVENLEGRLLIEDEVGKIVLRTDLRSSSTIISTAQLLSGYYVYKFYSENAPIVTGKLIIIK